MVGTTQALQAYASISTSISERSTQADRPEKLVFQITGAFAEFERSDLAQALAGRGLSSMCPTVRRAPKGTDYRVVPYD